MESFVQSKVYEGESASANFMVRLFGIERESNANKQHFLIPGMADELTETVAEGFVADGGVPLTLKYLPYGKLSEVLPYLGRRAVENKALLTGESGAAAERNRVVQEIKRRMGWSSQHKGDNVKKITV